jgi:hypothetical protein
MPIIPDFITGGAVSPGPQDRCAVTSMDTAETLRAMLLFDRVLYPPINIDEKYIDMVFFDGDVFEQSLIAGQAETYVRPGDIVPIKTEFKLHGRTHFIRAASVAYQERGYHVTPCYDSEEHLNAEFGTGAFKAYMATIKHIPVVIPDGPADWPLFASEETLKKIAECRRDVDAVRRYRDLRLWLEHSLEAETVDQAVDIIGQKIDDYKWSLQKHGFITALGAFSQLLNVKHSLALASAFLVGHTLAGPMGGLLASGVMMSAQCACAVGEKLIDYEDAKRGADREVAILVDLEKKLNG